MSGLPCSFIDAYENNWKQQDLTADLGPELHALFGARA